MVVAVPPGSKYVLPRNKPEGDRLELQHTYLRHTLYDDRLIYDQKVNIPTNGHVLDAGTGTGIWLMELAEELPYTVQLQGVDVSRNLFPSEPPANVTFSQESVTSLPTDWSGRFDFVNQRLLMAGLLASEWPEALSEFFRVLKPGGCAQFAELVTDPSPDASANTRRHDALRAALFRERKLMLDCAVELPRMLEAAGFVNVRVEPKVVYIGKAGGKFGVMGKDALAGSFRGMKGPVMQAKGLGIVRSERDFDDLMDALEEEWDEGEPKGYKFHLVCAEKPSTM